MTALALSAPLVGLALMMFLQWLETRIMATPRRTSTQGDRRE